MQQFCYKIGTTLRIIEEGTPWANKAELYIGLLKEEVRKDMKQANCALAFGIIVLNTEHVSTTSHHAIFSNLMAVMSISL